VLSKLRSYRPTHATLVAYLALFVALGGSSYAAMKVTGKDVPKDALTGADIKNLTGKDVRNNSLTGADVRNLTSGDIANGTLLAEDFAPGQLPSGGQGPKGDTGAAGATNVAVRWSGQAFASGGGPPIGSGGGFGAFAGCTGRGCLARGGAGGDANGANQGGAGGNGNCDGQGCLAQGGPGGKGSPVGTGGTATCSGAGCSMTNGAGGSGTATRAQSGEGATVGERAECLPGERAVGGGFSGTERSAIIFKNHPVALTSNPSASDPPADGQPANAWYAEAYNESHAGENRDASSLTLRTFVLCASP
jgi:hypothetical protein